MCVAIGVVNIYPTSDLGAAPVVGEPAFLWKLPTMAAMAAGADAVDLGSDSITL